MSKLQKMSVFENHFLIIDPMALFVRITTRKLQQIFDTFQTKIDGLSQCVKQRRENFGLDVRDNNYLNCTSLAGIDSFCAKIPMQ